MHTWLFIFYILSRACSESISVQFLLVPSRVAMAATAAMNFIRPDAVHDIEKPYLLQYPVRDKSQPRTNISHIMHGEIQVFNLRDHLKTLTFEKSGISTLYFEDASIPHDWDDTTTVRTKFLPVVAVKLKELLGAESVQVFEHIVSPSF